MTQRKRSKAGSSAASSAERSEAELAAERRGRPGRRTAEERTQAVLELLGGKATLGGLARRFGVRETTIEKWKAEALTSIQKAMRQGDGRSSRERELEKELKALREAFTDLAIRHELRERALKDRPTRPGRSSS